MKLFAKITKIDEDQHMVFAMPRPKPWMPKARS